MAGFTARIVNGYKAEVSCRGANHRDQATFGRCDGCYATVAKSEGGKVFDTHMSGGNYPVETYYCWRAHRCDAERVASVATEKAAQIASGEIIKGATVEVFKGRKVPIGTTGFVIWFGEGQWGERVGIKDQSGQVHWTAATNVRVIQPEEVEEAPPAADPNCGKQGGCEAHDGECAPLPLHQTPCVCGTYDRCWGVRVATARTQRDLYRAYND